MDNLIRYSTLKRNIFFFNLVMLLTAFNPFIGERNENFLFLGVMIFSLIITSGSFSKPHKKDLIIYFLLITLIISGYYNLIYFRFSSYLYAVLFILFFISNLNLLRYGRIKIIMYQNLLKLIIYLYLIVLIVQQVMYSFGIENLFNEISSEGWKFNVLHTEPSYAASVVILLFYSYIYIRKIKNKSFYLLPDFIKDYKLWIAFTYIMLTIGSSYGILFFILFLLSFIKNISKLVVIFLLLLFVYYISLSNDFTPVVRLNEVILSFRSSSLDYSAIVEADHSASVRIIPLLLVASSFEFYSLLGMGMDFSKNYFPTVVPGIEEGGYNGGLIPSFIIDNGLLNAFMLFLVIKKRVIHNFFSFEFILLFFILMNTSFNSQLFWSVMTIFSVNMYFKNH